MESSAIPAINIPNAAAADASPTPPDADAGLRRACAEAVEELKAARSLLSAQGIQIERQNELIKLEREITARVSELRDLDEQEKTELRNALAAAERQIAAVNAQVDVLKNERPSAWSKFKWIGYGIAIGVVAGVVLNK